MGSTQETSVTSSQDTIPSADVPTKPVNIKNDGGIKLSTHETKSSIADLFPWISEFKKKCRSLLGHRSMVALVRLMKFYARNVSINVNECYTKPYRAAKLKDFISETLLFFLFYYRELVEVFDRTFYLDKMSDLLAMYMDMELKASRRGKEPHSKIAARLTSCLYVYLENSTEYLLDTLIKVRFMSRNYHDILDPIVTKIFKTIPLHPNSDTMYVRYLLAYRLWKKVNNDAAVKNHINVTAISRLGPPPSSPPPFLAKYVLPKVPKAQVNSTKFLLLHKFDIEKSCQLFVQFCRESREDEDQGDLDKISFIAHTPGANGLEALGGTGICNNTIRIDNLTNTVDLPAPERSRQTELASIKLISQSVKPLDETGTKPLTQVPHSVAEKAPVSKPNKPTRVLPRLKPKKTNEILLIDLTADESTGKVIKKKKHNRLAWLKEAKKRVNTKLVEAAQKKEKKKRIAVNNSLTDTIATSSCEPGGLSSPTVFRSFSTATNPESQNCVTSATEIDESAMSEQTEISGVNTSTATSTGPLTCGVTATGLISTGSNKLECSNLNISQSKPGQTDLINQSQGPRNSSPMSKQIRINKPMCDTRAIIEASTTLVNISEIYDSDSVLEVSSDQNLYSDPMQCSAKIEESSFGKFFHPAIHIEPGTDTVAKYLTDQSISIKNLGMVNGIEDELSECSELKRRCSESSDIAVIFTQDCSKQAKADHDKNANTSEQRLTCSSDAVTREPNSSHETVTHNFELFCHEEIDNDVDIDPVTTTVLVNSPKIQPFRKYRHPAKIEDIQICALPIGNDKKNMHQKVVEDQDETELLTNERFGVVLDGKLVEEENETNNATNYKALVKQVENGRASRTILKNALIVSQHDEAQDETDSEIHVNEFDSVKEVNEQNVTKEELEEFEKLVGSVSGESCCSEPTELQQSGDIDQKQLVALHVIDSDNQNSNESLVTQFITTEMQDLNESFHTSCTAMRDIEINVSTPSDANDTANKSITEISPIQVSEFNENIDGLSLLASVSQQVPHLRAPSVKPKDILDKFSPTEKFSSKTADTESMNSVPLSMETTINHDLNIILSGETVVLLQKSPNSNLYIINKAVENKEGYSSDNETNLTKDDGKEESPRMERVPSSELFDIINNIPPNFDLSQYGKERQDAVNTPRRRKKSIYGTMKPIKSEPDEDNELESCYENTAFDRHSKPSRGTDSCIRESEYEITKDDSQDSLRVRCTDTPGSVVELEPVQKTPPPVIRLTDTPIDRRFLMNQSFHEEPAPLNMATTRTSIDKHRNTKYEDKPRGMLNENLTCRQSIKQEFNSSNCGSDMRPVSHQVTGQSFANSKCRGPNDGHGLVDSQNSLHILQPHSNNLSEVYSAAAPHAYIPHHELCNQSPCGLQVSSNRSLHPLPMCGRAHCSCLKCSYDVAENCKQYAHPSIVVHPSYHQTNSYFLPTHPTVQTSTVQEYDGKLGGAALAKLCDDKLLQNVEKSIVDSKPLDVIKCKPEIKYKPEVKYRPEMDNKLPLKKRLKAHAMLSMIYDDTPTKVENYPGTPMMSIAALETQDDSRSPNTDDEKKSTHPSSLELSPKIKDDPCVHQNTTEMVRRDYRKDNSSISSSPRKLDEKLRKYERRQSNGQTNNTLAGHQPKSFLTPAQRKEVLIPTQSSLKRSAATAVAMTKPPKKSKKTQLPSSARQTRSSKRNIPKVNYSCLDFESEWNISVESKRKRKNNGR